MIGCSHPSVQEVRGRKNLLQARVVHAGFLDETDPEPDLYRPRRNGLEDKKKGCLPGALSGVGGEACTPSSLCPPGAWLQGEPSIVREDVMETG